MARELDRPPFVADERTQLMGWYGLQRQLVPWKCKGLVESDTHRSVLATSPLMTPAGLVSHLRWAEHCWFDVMFLGEGIDVNPMFGDGPDDADMLVDDTPLEQLLIEYADQCSHSDDIIASHSLDDVGRNPDFGSAQATLRWMILHMIEETARHVGHLDIIRETLDGNTGYS